MSALLNSRTLAFTDYSGSRLLCTQARVFTSPKDIVQGYRF